jgi:hypothetical protein
LVPDDSSMPERAPMFVKLSTAPLWNGRRPHGLSTGLLQSPCSTVPASLMHNHGSTFWGVYAVHPLNEIRGGNIDLYYLGLARKNAPFERGSQNELRHTVGGRYWGGRNCKAPTTLKDAQGCRGFEFRRSRGSLADAILRAFYVQGRRRRRATSR